MNLTPKSQREAKQNQNKRESSKPVTMEPQKVQGTSQHKGELSTLFSKLGINHFVYTYRFKTGSPHYTRKN